MADVWESYLRGQQGVLAPQAAQLQQATGAIGILGKVREMQQQEQVRGILSQTGGDLNKAIPALIQSGNPYGITIAQHLGALSEQQTKMAQVKRESDFRNQLANNPQAFMSGGSPAQPAEVLPDNVMGPASPAIPAVPGKLDPNKLLTGYFGAGLGDPLKYATEQIAANKATPIPPNSTHMIKNGEVIPIPGATGQPMIEHSYPVAGDKVQPHISYDRGQTWQPIPGSVASPKFAKQVISVDTGSKVELTPEELGPMAWEKLLFGTNPPGMGNASAKQRQQVNLERARLGRSLGLSDMEMAMLPQDNKVKMKAVDTLTKWGATVGRAAEKLDLDLKVAIDYAQKLPLGMMQTVNKGVIAGMKEFNNPNANAYATAINSVRQEYARLMMGPTSNAMLPVEAMKKGNELLSSGVDVPSLAEIGNQMRRDASNTMTATNSQIGALRGSITGLGKQPTFNEIKTGDVTSPKIPEFSTQEDALKSGVRGKVKINGRNATIGD